MMKKTKRKSLLPHTLSLGLKVAVFAETFAFIGSYLLWRKMNRDIDLRYKMHQRAPYILECYYAVGDKIGGCSSRAADYDVWGIQQ